MLMNICVVSIIWLFLVLVSEHIITYYNLILSLNKYEKELNDIIDKNNISYVPGLAAYFVLII